MLLKKCEKLNQFGPSLFQIVKSFKVIRGTLNIECKTYKLPSLLLRIEPLSEHLQSQTHKRYNKCRNSLSKYIFLSTIFDAIEKRTARGNGIQVELLLTHENIKK